jgi:hypothetical protein
MTRFECPGCGAVYSADADKAGKTGQCPACQAQFVIPAAPADAPPPTADPAAPCPGCGVRLAVAPADVGQDVECPYCATVFQAARPRPARRSRRSEDEDEEYEPRRRRSRKPGEVTGIGVMLLSGGIVALLMGAMVGVSLCCLWPVSYLSLVWGVLAIIRGSQMLGPRDDLQGPPRVLLVLQVVLILNGDVINCVLGIVGLVLLNNPAVRDYYTRDEE